jgi:glycerol-3-phosphate acyltransferase PlsY
MLSEFSHSLTWQADGPNLLIAFVNGYLLGSIPFGLILTRLSGGGDIRKVGSGSIGATNVLRTGNYWAAGGTLLFDALKGVAAVLIARAYFGEFATLVAGLAAFLGHLFPVWLRFKGGKGIAVALGIMLALYWPAALAMLATWLAVLAITRISSLSALVTAIVAPIILYLLVSPAHGAFGALLAVMVFYAHRANIARLLNGTEPRVGAKASAAE